MILVVTVLYSSILPDQDEYKIGWVQFLYNYRNHGKGHTMPTANQKARFWELIWSIATWAATDTSEENEEGIT